VILMKEIDSSPSDCHANGHHIAVMVATALPFGDGVLDYRTDTVLPTGQIVIVPLGQRDVAGVVVGAARGDVVSSKIKPIKLISDLPPLSADMIDFMRWVASWTLSPVGAVLKMVLPLDDALMPPTPVAAWRVAPDATRQKLTKTRAQVLKHLADMPPMTTRTAADLSGVSTSTITAMAKAGLLVETETGEPELPSPQALPAAYDLSPEQAAAAAELRQAVASRGFAPFVLDGVTGSGKTEVYFDAIAAVVEAGQQAVILLPEIALSPAMQDRFSRRFGAPPVIWHSGLTQRQRICAFRAVAKGGAQVIIGARSALFLPYPDLGLIVVDEEHDQSFKQDDHVPYHARDMAVVRAKITAIPIVLASATPSLETEVNIDNGRYTRLQLAARVGSACLPKIELVDLRQHPPQRQHWIAPPMVKAIEDELAAGHQVLLFLNRRGYAPLTLCRTCGGRIICPHCDAGLVTHKRDFAMHCHHCGHRMPCPDECPSCGAEDSLVQCGPGVERLAEEALQRFPHAKQAVLSSDLMTTAESFAAFTDDVIAGRIDIIIGTQMVAKGHHFPNLKLVGVMDADLGLAGGDLRAAETTWQLLVQVAGRAGRTGSAGRALLQTVAPETPVFKALISGGREAFLNAEKAGREEAGMPPYGRLAAIILSGRREEQVASWSAALGRVRPDFGGVTILGPAAAPIFYLRGRYRFRFLIKAGRDVDIQTIIQNWLQQVRFPSSVRVQVDIDPYYFL
jgi:primosomal protein N' (replication factor Y)